MSDAIRNEAVEIVAGLADGYNRYYGSDKAKCYARARSCVCRVQCLLLLASSLEAADRGCAEELCRKYEESLKMFNGLVKLFEERRMRC